MTMDWTTWRPFYSDIIERLDIDSTKDYEATSLLSELLQDIDPAPMLQQMQKSIPGKTVIIYGGGPSLSRHIDFVQGQEYYDSAIHFAVDGAISGILEKGGECDFIVTDLDGTPADILSSVNQGAIPIVHAHGDNIPQLKSYVKKMDVALGSTQVEPLYNVFLWGGFTDGDRACFLASHYSPRRMILAGMDFGDTVGKWSKPGHSDSFPASDRKKTKLEIAQELLQYLWSTTGIAYDYVQDMCR
jgi:uncharacterized Rossmann fold enzyme